MKKVWILGLLSALLACNNESTTSQPTDRDHTENKDTPAVVTDSTTVSGTRADTLSNDSLHNRNNK